MTTSRPIVRKLSSASTPPPLTRPSPTVPSTSAPPAIRSTPSVASTSIDAQKATEPRPLVGLQYNRGISPQRILIQGPPGTRKTGSAITFPNPLVLNFDNKLPYFAKDIANIPFYDPAYRQALYKAHGVDPAFENLRDAFKLWLEKEMPKIDQENTTTIIDSWTMLNNTCVTQGLKERKMTKTGEYDNRQMYGEILNYCFYV